MNQHLENVKQFHEVFGSNVEQNPIIPSKERVRLRLGLILEELTELAQASGTEALNIFKEMLLKKHNQIDTGEISSTPEGSIKECLDALCDIDYVMNGSVLEYGLHFIFDRACNDVHLSNMSKVCKNKEEAELTIKSQVDGPENYEISEYDPNAGGYVVYRKSDKKVIKSINYNKVNLEKYVQ